MRKILLFVFVLVGIVPIQAQTYDETDLLGKWNVTSITGQVNNSIISFESLYLGDTLVTQVGEGEVDDWWLNAGYLGNAIIYSLDQDTYNPQYTETIEQFGVVDFFISNNNKLHIQMVSTNEIRMVIKEWTNNVMKLESYDGKTKIELKKDSSAVDSVTAEITGEDNIYNVQGLKVTRPKKGNIYIHNNRKYIAR